MFQHIHLLRHLHFSNLSYQYIHTFGQKYSSILCNTVYGEQTLEAIQVSAIRHWLSGVCLYNGILSIRMGHFLCDIDPESCASGLKGEEQEAQFNRKQDWDGRGERQEVLLDILLYCSDLGWCGGGF